MKGELTPKHIKWISSQVSLKSLTNIAVEVMGFSMKEIHDVLDNFKPEDNIYNEETYKSEILKVWAERNPGDDQLQVSLKLGVRSH